MKGIACAIVATAALASCEGVLGGIYDEPFASEVATYGFVADDDDMLGGTIYVDVSTYDRWVYIDLHQRRIDTSQREPQAYDLALHHYDAATHGGAVAATAYSSADEAVCCGTEQFVADVDSTVIVDISHMMDGDLLYAPASVNPVLSRWMQVDLSHMPPTYTFCPEVYLLRMADGTTAALQFVDYKNPTGQKGYATIRYRYPLP